MWNYSEIRTKINKMENRAKIRKIKWCIQDIKYLISAIPERANKENVEEEILKELKKIAQTEEYEYPGCCWLIHTMDKRPHIKISIKRTKHLKLQHTWVKRRSFINASKGEGDKGVQHKTPRIRTASGLSAPEACGQWGNNFKTQSRHLSPAKSPTKDECRK